MAALRRGWGLPLPRRRAERDGAGSVGREARGFLALRPGRDRAPCCPATRFVPGFFLPPGRSETLRLTWPRWPRARLLQPPSLAPARCGCAGPAGSQPAPCRAMLGPVLVLDPILGDAHPRTSV